MDEFEKWDIKLVLGNRNKYVVSGEGGKKTVLKTRADVVVFLDQNKTINLRPSDFVFKQNAEIKPSRNENEMDICESNDPISGATAEVAAENGQKRLIEGEADDGVSAKIKRVSADSSCDHADKFDKLLHRIHEIRNDNAELPLNLSGSTITHLRTILTDLSIEDNPVSLVKEICKCPELFTALKVVFRSKIETEIELNSVSHPKTPVTMEFPPSCDNNFYCAVIEEAAEKMPNFLAFLVNILDSNEQNVSPSYVIKLATIICELLSSKESSLQYWFLNGI